MLKYFSPIMILIIFSFSGCLSSSHDEGVDTNTTVFNPTLTSKYRYSDDYVKDIDCFSDVCIAGTPSIHYRTSGEATLLSLQSDGTMTTQLNLYPDNNASGYGNQVAIDENYVIVSDKSGYIYLYKRQADKNIELMKKINVNHAVDDIAMYDDFFLLSNSYNALLYHIDTNGSATLKSTIAPENNDTSLGFGFRAELSKDYLVIEQRKGVSALIYNYNLDGNTTFVETIHPSTATQNDNSFSMSLYENKLLIGINGATLYTFSKDGNSSQTPIIPMAGASDKYVGRSVSLNAKYLSVEDQRGDSLYTINEDGIKPLYRINDTKYSTYDLSIEGSQFTTNGYAKIHYLDGILYFYDFYPANQIYNYNYPKGAIKLPENESPATIFNVDAFSNDGNLNYKVEGEDSAYFEMNGTTLLNNTAFDYESPVDSNGDNHYQVDIIIEDEAGHSLKLPIEIDVENHDYVYQKSFSFLSNNFSLSNIYQDDLFFSVVEPNSGNRAIDIWHKDVDELTKIESIIAPKESVEDLGGLVSVNAKRVFASASDINYTTHNETKVVLSYVKDSNGKYSYEKQLVGDDNNSRSDFGVSLYTDDSILAIGEDHKYDATRDANGTRIFKSGAVYIYKNDANLTKIQNIKPNFGIADGFGTKVVFNDWLMAVSASKLDKVYFYTKNSDETWQKLRELTPQVDDHGKEVLAINNKYLVISGSEKSKIYALNKTVKSVDYMTDINNTASEPTTISLDNDELFVKTEGDGVTKHYHLSLENDNATYVEALSAPFLNKQTYLSSDFIATQGSLYQEESDGKTLIWFKKENGSGTGLNP